MAVDLGSGAWEVADNSGRAGVALKARAGPRTLSVLSRGLPVLVQASVGALGLRLRYSGRVVRGDWGYSVGVQGRCVRASSGVGSELRVVLVAPSFGGLVLGLAR